MSTSHASGSTAPGAITAASVPQRPYQSPRRFRAGRAASRRLPDAGDLRQVWRVLRGAAWVAGLLLSTASCVGTRSTPSTRYLGILLNARDLAAAQRLPPGAGEVMRQAAADPTIKAYVAQHGNPDFVLQASRLDTQLIYVRRSVLAYFRREKPDAPSAVTEVTPLPSGLFLMLPSDLRAGT